MHANDTRNAATDAQPHCPALGALSPRAHALCLSALITRLSTHATAHPPCAHTAPPTLAPSRRALTLSTHSTPLTHAYPSALELDVKVLLRQRRDVLRLELRASLRLKLKVKI